MTDRLTTERRKMQIGAIHDFMQAGINNAADREKTASTNKSDISSFYAIMNQRNKKCPYSSLAQDGVINYNGVQFVCDMENNAISLGDISDPKKVLKINLPSGGLLKVNVDNLEDLSKAAGMFTPEDLNAIMRAVHEYKHCQRKLNEIEDDKNADPESAEANDAVEETQDAMQKIKDYKESIYQKVINGDTEQKFQIGAEELSIKEWDRVLEDFDKAEDKIKNEIKEEIEKRREKELTEEQLERLLG